MDRYFKKRLTNSVAKNSIGPTLGLENRRPIPSTNTVSIDFQYT